MPPSTSVRTPLFVQLEPRHGSRGRSRRVCRLHDPVHAGETAYRWRLIGSLTALAPYRWLFVGLALRALGYAGYNE